MPFAEHPPITTLNISILGKAGDERVNGQTKHGKEREHEGISEDETGDNEIYA